MNKGTFHIVSGPAGTKTPVHPLLTDHVVILCGALELEVRGDVLGTFNLAGESEAEELTSLGTMMKGEKGKLKSPHFHE